MRLAPKSSLKLLPDVSPELRLSGPLLKQSSALATQSFACPKHLPRQSSGCLLSKPVEHTTAPQSHPMLELILPRVLFQVLGMVFCSYGGSRFEAPELG